MDRRMDATKYIQDWLYNVLGSTRLSVCLFALLSFQQRFQLPVHRLCQCVCNQGDYTNNLTDATDRL